MGADMDIDSLQIKIKGTAQGANKSVNQLIKNLDKLQSKLSGLDTSKLNAFSNNSTKASNSSKKLSNSLNTLSVSATRSTKSFKGLASAFGRFYANYFLVVRGIKGLWSSVESTADYIESFNYYTVAFGKIASEWDKDWENYGSENARNYSNAFVTSMNSTLEKLSGVKLSIGEDGQGLLTTTGGSNLGLNIQEITQYASQLASVTNSLGQTGQTSLAISSSFTKLAGDISSLFNVDYSTVAQNLQSGLIGQSRALYKYGIDITNATLQTYAYELGIEKAVSEMSQMEKQQLRVLAILDQSEVAFGDLANTINSPSNMIRQMNNNFKEASIILGQLFMPVVENVLPMVNGLSIALKRLLTDIAGFMGITIDMDAYGQGFMETEDAIDGITDGLDEAVESSNKLLNNLRGFDKLNVISTKSGASSSGLSGALDLTNEIIKATEEYEKKWNEAFANMENKSKEISNSILKYFNIISNEFSDIFDFSSVDITSLVSALEKLETFSFNGLEIFYGRFLKPLSEWAFSEAIPEVINIISNFVNNIDWSTLESLWTNLSGLLSDIIRDFGDGLLNVFGEVEPSITPAINSLTSLLNTFLEDVLVPIWDFIDMNILPLIEDKLINSITEFSEDVQRVSSDIEDILNGITMFVNDVFSGDWESAWIDVKIIASDVVESMKGSIEDGWQDILDVFGVDEDFFSGIEDAFNNVIDSIKKIWNDFANGLNNALTFEIGGISQDLGIFGKIDIPSFTIDFGNIPTFSIGGFPEDGLFFANHNELVGQFSNGQTAVANNEQITKGISDAVYPAVYNAITDAFGGNRNAQKVVVQIDGREVFSVVRSEASNYTRRTGQPAFG